MEQFPDGKMDKESFVRTFHLAFPERPEDRVVKLADEMANKDGKICKCRGLIFEAPMKTIIKVVAQHVQSITAAVV